MTLHLGTIQDRVYRVHRNGDGHAFFQAHFHTMNRSFTFCSGIGGTLSDYRSDPELALKWLEETGLAKNKLATQRMQALKRAEELEAHAAKLRAFSEGRISQLPEGEL